jgi:hypothetical protein
MRCVAVLMSVLAATAIITGCSDDDEATQEAVRNVVQELCTPDVFPTCPGGAVLGFTVSGRTTQNSFVWAALERNGELIAHSAGRPIPPGAFRGYPLEIEMGGLQLEPDYEYDLVFYQSDDSTNIGIRKTRATASGPMKLTFTAAEVNAFASMEQPKSTGKTTDRQGAPYCVVTGLPYYLRLLKESDAHSYELVILPCSDTTTETCKTLQWYYGGNMNPIPVLPTTYGTFMPLHKTPDTNYFWIAVRDTAPGANINRCDTVYLDIDYPTDVGYRFGSTYNWVDTLVEEFADSIGFIPQLLKAQIRQEAGPAFNVEAYRYEPRYDWRYVSIGATGGQYRLGQSPYSWYRLATPYENGHAALAQGDSLETADRDRGKWKYTGTIDNNGNGYLSAWEYINGNSSEWDCDDDQCPPSGVDFTAQTAIASSYGLMQLMWPTPLSYGANWNGGRGDDPHELFDPRLNLQLASRVVRFWFDAANWNGNWSDYERAVDSTLRGYNQNHAYSDDVRQWLGDYSIEYAE